MFVKYGIEIVLCFVKIEGRLDFVMCNGVILAVVDDGVDCHCFVRGHRVK